MNYHHEAFQVSNMDSSIDFYTGKLGFKLQSRDIDEDEQIEFSFLKLGSASIELIRDLREEYRKPEIKMPYCPHFCMKVQNIGHAAEILVKKGIPILHGPIMGKDGVSWMYFSDPDNNILEYIQLPKKK